MEKQSFYLSLPKAGATVTFSVHLRSTDLLPGDVPLHVAEVSVVGRHNLSAGSL